MPSSVKVLTTAKKPAVGIQVWLLDKNKTVASGVTNSAGIFTAYIRTPVEAYWGIGRSAIGYQRTVPAREGVRSSVVLGVKAKKKKKKKKAVVPLYPSVTPAATAVTISPLLPSLPVTTMPVAPVDEYEEYEEYEEDEESPSMAPPSAAPVTRAEKALVPAITTAPKELSVGTLLPILGAAGLVLFLAFKEK